MKHDVIIIGGSLAGAACVRELTRLGVDAIALERERFPRRKVCGGFLSPGAAACLAHLGVLDACRKSGAVEVRSARITVDSTEVDFPFERPGFGISRSVLDDIVGRVENVKQGHSVTAVRRNHAGFMVDGVQCRVLIDAAGKLSRFTKRRAVAEFGVQYQGPSPVSPTLDFRFFEEGYGGTVSIEGGQSNSCFLIRKNAVNRYANRADCLVTGPLAYDRLPGAFIAIGDAAGMVDPFCGEGMRHALESGMLAAGIVARAFRRSATYEEMKWEYEAEWERKWSVRRAIGFGIRRMLAKRKVFAAAVCRMPAFVLNRLWD